jgi:peptidoglycan hydrolase-like protein with peptidoglycan-binding domain
MIGLLFLSAGCSATAHARAAKSSRTPSSSVAASTTSTIPAVLQPRAVTLPTPPPGGIGPASHGAIVLAYQRRLKELHFDPGPLNGVFSSDTEYATVAVEKLLGVARDGVIGAQVQAGLEHFAYQVALPNAEGDRVEINLDTQVITVYKRWQPILVTTTSTGSGEYFCGGNDGCQYAITPTGHFHFQWLHRGWDTGKLGTMWNPYYFDGGIAIHGLQSVPSSPASHGCARIPMHVADYFPTLVSKGESVYVVGTPMKPGNLYVGPVTTIPSSTSTSSTTVPRPTTTTTRHPVVITTPTTRPHTITTVHAHA